MTISSIYVSFLQMFLQLVQVSPPCSRVQLGHGGVSGVQSVGGDGVRGAIKMEV